MSQDGGTTVGLHSSRTQRRAASDETIRDLARQVSKQMLKPYSHIRMEAKQRAVNLMAVKVKEVAAGAGTIKNGVAQAVPTKHLDRGRRRSTQNASQSFYACGWR